MRFEADFVAWCDQFYNAVRDGDSREEIARMRHEMVFAIRQGFFDIVKTQTMAVLVLVLVLVMVMVVFAPSIFEALGISSL